MISRQRMKIDTWGQATLLLSLLIVALVGSESGGLIGWILLFLWQMTSALLLYKQFAYQQRKLFLWVGLASIPVAILGKTFLLYFLIGFSLWYFYNTVLDTIKVLKRPRSFWDLG